MNVRRRSLLAGVGLGSLALIPSRAIAQTPFTSFSFTGTGEPAARTQPDRIADVKNVKDFGAKGDGSTDDTTAIQNAVNWTSNADRGTIFFPPGIYITSSPITFNAANLTICFQGQGNASTIKGVSFALTGYLLDRALGSPSNTAQVVIEGLSLLLSDNGNGCIRVGSCKNVLIRNCSVGGPVGITTEDSPGVSSQNVKIQNVLFQGGTTGLIMGNSGSVESCDWISYTLGACMYGKGWFMGGNRIEECATAYQIGLDSSGTDQGASGFTINNGTTEANYISFSLAGTCNGFYIGSVAMLGHDQSFGNQAYATLPISSYTYNSGTGQVVLTMTSAIPTAGQTGTTLGVHGLNIAGLNGNFSGGVISGGGRTVTYTGPTGQAGSPSGGGTLGLGTQYGIIVSAGKATNGVFAGLNTGNFLDVAGASIGNASSRANLLFIGCSMQVGAGPGSTWITPTNAYTATFVNSNTNPIWQFSQLPAAGGANVLEGDEFSISDSPTATWGANVTTGSGSNHILVRYNGTNFTVVAK